jgi:iron(III) transport system ATP-binding protein
MPETFATASITLENLNKSFGAMQAVDNVSLQVPTGALVCLLGPSGCGKTTTLRMIGGFEEPTSGRILIGDDEVTNLPPYVRPTAMVFQSYALFPHMSVYDNIAYGLRARRVPRAEVQTRVQEVVALMELAGQERKAPPQLSGGQQQRVALARALVIRPKVLLFDEPLSNLDAQLRVRMRSEIRSVQRRLGITSVYVTHDQEEAFVAEFVGLSNVVPAEIVGPDAGGTLVRVFGQLLRSRRPPRHPGPEATLVLRPEAMQVAKAGGSGVPGHVLTLAFVGPLVRYTVALEDGTVLTVDLHNPGPEQFFAEGTPVTVQLPEEVPALLG